jgi:hypothetical protein
MDKILIMSTAVIGSVLFGQPLMAAVFASVMVTGLLTAHLANESVRRVMKCPAMAFKPAVDRLKPRRSA